MKLFECQHCGQLLYFENTRCERCKHVLGYLPERAELSALAPLDGQRWRPLIAPEQLQRFCANAAHDACNWLVPAQGPNPFCQACRLNRTIPDLGPPDHLLRWQRLEAAKHRLVYGLLRLGLPVVSRFEDRQAGLAFDFLAEPDPTGQQAPQVVTGHAGGLITINIAEADDAERERTRQAMGEPYRTLLGHFRHEVGHYYWDRLVRDGVWLDAFREHVRRRPPGLRRLPRGAPRRGPAARTGRSASSAATPAPIPGRTSPRPSRTTCTSSTRWRPPPPSACGSPPRPDTTPPSR